MYSNPAFNGPAASLGCPLSVNSGNLATPVDLPNGQSNVMAKGVFHLASSADSSCSGASFTKQLTVQARTK